MRNEILHKKGEVGDEIPSKLFFVCLFVFSHKSGYKFVENFVFFLTNLLFFFIIKFKNGVIGWQIRNFLSKLKTKQNKKHVVFG